jgi:hypothetical protein
MRDGVTISADFAFKALFLFNNTILNAGLRMTFWANRF